MELCACGSVVWLGIKGPFSFLYGVRLCGNQFRDADQVVGDEVRAVLKDLSRPPVTQSEFGDLSYYLLQRGPHAPGPSRFDRFRHRYHDFSARVVRQRWIVVPAYLAGAALIIVVVGGTLGRAIFPTVDAGQFTLRMRATAGTRIEETEKLANKTLDIVRREAGPQNVEMTLGFVGVQNAQYPINTIYLWTSGPEEAVIQVQLSPKAGIRVADLEERLRQKLSQGLPGMRYSF